MFSIKQKKMKLTVNDYNIGNDSEGAEDVSQSH